MVQTRYASCVNHYIPTKKIYVALLEEKHITRKVVTCLGLHYIKCVCIWSFSGPYFPAFGLNTERYSVSLCIQFKLGKIRTRKTPNTDMLYAVVGPIYAGNSLLR